MANGIAQGCPASPDLLNILFEPFHRWAGSQGVGVKVLGDYVASSSFADDVALLATSQPEVELLVGAYQAWCHLLGIQLHLLKTELWCSELPGGQTVVLQLESGPLQLTTRSTFKMVGIELGNSEKAATVAHLEARLPSALQASRRLAGLSLPAAVAVQMWRTAVLPQALYGCEVRNVTMTQLMPVWVTGKKTIPMLAPLELSSYAAVEVLGGLPLGCHALRDPRLEMVSRRLRWLQTVGNASGLVGTLHRELASGPGGTWNEPSAALSAALTELHWQVRRNPAAFCASRWPILEPEPQFRGMVRLTPNDDPAPSGTVWTDGSVGSSGGAAALQWHSDICFQTSVPNPRSSTHCELVALNLVVQFPSPPPLILSDSLCSLQLIGSWGRRPPRVTLACTERSLIREFILQWNVRPAPPVLEKVKAHNDAAAAAGDVKALGNTAVDTLAKQAASGAGVVLGAVHPRYQDAVQLCDASGTWQLNLSSAVSLAWWEKCSREAGGRRSWLAQLYPPGLELDWPTSCIIFRRPTVAGDSFVYAVPQAVLKWVARARSGALATRGRLAKTHTKVSISPACPACSATMEDDGHAIAGCQVTGSADLASLVPNLWLTACGKPSAVPLPPPWVAAHLLQLAVGLIPTSLRSLVPNLEKWELGIVLRRFHLSLCSRLAEVLRRREQLVALSSPTPSSSPGLGPPPSVRNLTVAELRAAEACPSKPKPAPTAAKTAHQLRAEKLESALSLNSWVKTHPFLQAVPLDQGEASVALLLLWEADHKKLYPAGKVDIRSRLQNFSKRLTDAVAADAELSVWMHSKTKLRGVLSPGLKPSCYTRWAVRIKPEVGEPFLGSWKAYLASVVQQQQQGLVGRVHGRSSSPSSTESRRSAKRPKPAPARTRKRAASASAPLHTKKDRLERLLAAKAAQAAKQAAPGVAPSSASASSASSSVLGGRDPVSPSAGPRALPPGLT